MMHMSCRLRVVAPLVLACVAAMDYAGSDYESLFGSGSALGVCQTFSCEPGRAVAPKRPLKFDTTQTCREMFEGTGGVITENWGDGHVLDDSPLLPCCVARQVCGQICGTYTTDCDKPFSQCMVDTCKTSDDDRCALDAYWLERWKQEDGTRCQQHAREQAGVCRCVAADDVGKMREKILTDAFKRHAKADIHRVPGLMEKADSTDAFAEVLVGLVDAYPSIAGLPETEASAAARAQAQGSDL